MKQILIFVFALLVIYHYDFAVAQSAPNSFNVLFETTKGSFNVLVNRTWAPNGADHFYDLIQAEYYDNNYFFRVIDTPRPFVAQWGINGDPEVSQKWNMTIPDDKQIASNVEGTVTYAAEMNANGFACCRTTQLFINYGNNKFLDQEGFAPFGMITSGLDVALSFYSGYGENPDQTLIYEQVPQVEQVFVPTQGYYPNPSTCKLPIQIVIKDDTLDGIYQIAPAKLTQTISKVTQTSPPMSTILFTIEIEMPKDTTIYTLNITSTTTINVPITYNCSDPGLSYELLPYPVNVGVFVNYLVLAPIMATVKDKSYQQLQVFPDGTMIFATYMGPIYTRSPVLQMRFIPYYDQSNPLNLVVPQKVKLAYYYQNRILAPSLPDIPPVPTLPDTSEILDVKIYPSAPVTTIIRDQTLYSVIKAKNLGCRFIFSSTPSIQYANNYFKVGEKNGIATYFSTQFLTMQPFGTTTKPIKIFKYSNIMSIQMQMDAAYTMGPVTSVGFSQSSTQYLSSAILTMDINTLNVTGYSTLKYGLTEYKYQFPFGLYTKVGANRYRNRFNVFTLTYFKDTPARFDCYGASSIGFNMYNNIPGSTYDTEYPKVYDTSIVKISTFLNVLRFRATDDKSGVSKIRINIPFNGDGTVADFKFKAQDHLSSGSSLDGYYEFVIDSRNLSDYRIDLFVADVVGNVPSIPNPALYRSGFYYDTIGSIFPFPDFKLWTLINVTSFKFYSTEMNVTNGEVVNYVVFQLDNPDLSFVPFITFYNGKSYEKSNSDYKIISLNKKLASFYGYWDETISSFVIPFYISQFTIPDELSYELELGLSLDNIQLQSKFGSDARLTIISDFGDIMPPMITDAVPLQLDKMGWIITIEDEHFGFLRGEFEIISNTDALPYKVVVTQSDLVSGDKFKGNYTLAFAEKPPTTTTCMSQTFSIQSVKLLDDRPITLPGGIIDVHPLSFLVVPPTYILSCSLEPTDVSPPTLVSFVILETSIDVGLRPEDRIVHFTFTVTDDIEISPRHNPVVYISSINTEPLAVTSSFVSSVGKNINFESTFNLPYGFGEGNALYFSIYGIFDTAMNTNGYTSLNLQAINPSKFYVNRSHSFGPNLKSHSYITFRGGEIFIEGSSFKSLTGSGQPILTLDFKNGTTIEPIINNLYSVVFSFNVPPNLLQFEIFLTVNGLQSNILPIEP
eukprot:gene5132-6392_t